MDMLRYIRSRMPGTNEAKRSEREHFFRLSQTLYHGFPGKASCMAHDEELHLLAIGTRTGSLRVNGASGVEVVADHPHSTGVQRVHFVGDGHLVTLCSDSSLHLWRLVNTTTSTNEHRLELEHVRTVATDCKLKTIAASHVLHGENGPSLLLGTETGNVYSVDTRSLAITDMCIYDEIVANLDDSEFATSPAGRVETLAYATTTHLVAFGYTRGLIVVFDVASASVVRTYTTTAGVASIAFHACGTRLVTAHTDGSYVTWSTTSSTPEQAANIPFGPFPCKPLTRVLVGQLHADADLLVLGGGMPRASFGDKHTVAVQASEKHVVFDCTSAVLDVLLLADHFAHSLLILCEEEMIAIDLRHDDWATFALPYLHPLHASPITACVHVPNVAEHVWRVLQATRTAHNERVHSTRAWPIDGGVAESDDGRANDLLVTGHEDGHVRMWTCNRVSMHLLAAIQTSRPFDAFADTTSCEEEGDEEDWPPFRKCGHYDPYSDDPRVSVQRVHMDGLTGELVVGGSAGQVLVYALCDRDSSGANMTTSDTKTVQRQTAAIVAEERQFKWKGNEALVYVERETAKHECFEARAILQLHPPAAVTAVAIDTQHHVICAGTAHGFVVYDYATNGTLLVTCLLTEEEMTAARTLDGAMSRFKSFKKSVRDSIRRRRRTAQHSRTQTPTALDDVAEQPSPPKTQQKSPRRVRIAADVDDDDVRPMERQIGGRDENVAIGLPSLVKTIVFVETHVQSAVTTSRTLWVGTNGGLVYVHTIEGDQIALAKEVHLKHGAPVLSIQVDVETPHAHHVVISTEEQLKGFTLPALRPTHYKYKLTAHEGVRMRRITRATLLAESGDRSDTFVLVMTNNGTVHAFGHRHMRRYMHETCVRDVHDLAAVLSTVLTSRGDVLSLTARGSEWMRSSLGANVDDQLRARCHLPALPASANAIHAAHDAVSDVGEAAHDTTIDSNGLPGDQTLDSIKDHTTDEATTNGTTAPPSSEETTANGVTNGGGVTEGEKGAPTSPTTSEPTKSRHVRHGSVTVNVTSPIVDDDIARLKRQAQEQMKLDEEAAQDS